MKLNVGDRVLSTGNCTAGGGKEGYIIVVSNDNYLVEFDPPFKGHNGNRGSNLCPSKRGWWCVESGVSLIHRAALETASSVDYYYELLAAKTNIEEAS